MLFYQPHSIVLRVHISIECESGFFTEEEIVKSSFVMGIICVKLVTKFTLLEQSDGLSSQITLTLYDTVSKLLWPNESTNRWILLKQTIFWSNFKALQKISFWFQTFSLVWECGSIVDEPTFLQRLLREISSQNVRLMLCLAVQQTKTYIQTEK